MLQIRAFGDQIEQSIVRDIEAHLYLQMRQFRTTPRQQFHSFIGNATPLAEQYPFHLRTGHIPRVHAQSPQNAAQRPIADNVLAYAKQTDHQNN